MMKYANYLILSTLLLLGFLAKEHIHISSNLLSLFAPKEAIERLNIANKLGYAKEMLIAVKGFDNASKRKVKKIVADLKTIKGVGLIQFNITPSDEIQAYYKEYYPLLASFNSGQQSRKAIHQQLSDKYDSLCNSVFYSPIDKNDPLGLFTMPGRQLSGVSHKGTNITLEGYGYLIRVKTDVLPSQMSEAKALYKEVQTVLSAYPDTIAFAPFFYTVENSEKIQSDVQLIILLSTIILLVIYYLLINNIRLLLHTLLALSSSMLFATLATTLLFTDFNILSLAFGMSISAVSIDYLLHYHFHSFYQDERRIDKNVLYGFLTTTVAFGVFSVIPVPMIAQISFFAVLSLSFAYMLFTFVFPLLQIKAYKAPQQSVAVKNTSYKIPSSMIFIFSLSLLSYSVLNIQLDNNIRNLDYHNSELRAIEEIFKESNTNSYTPVIVQADSQKGLIEELHRLHGTISESFSLASFVLDPRRCQEKSAILHGYDFDTLRQMIKEEAVKVGFRENYFDEAYAFTKVLPSCGLRDLKIFESYGLSIYEEKGVYYSMALTADVIKAQGLGSVTSIDVRQMFAKVAGDMYASILFYSSIVLVIIILLLIYSVRTEFLHAFNYIIFPSGVVLACLVTFSTVNIMHIFSLIILIAIGIDYGIYMSNTRQRPSTILAIRYSLLSTFAAFGVLVFSTITALNSIGVVISIGILAIFLMIRIMR